MPPNSSKVKIVTLGCAKNDVDSEEIAGVLAGAGYAVGDGNSDVIIINTCGFLEAAKKESIEAIREAVKAKTAGHTKRVIVAGCLAQRLGAELALLAPGADAYVGVGQMGRFDEIVRATPSSISPGEDLGSRPARPGNGGGGRGVEVSQPLIDISPPHHRWADVETRARAGRPWSAYLKVSEGCDHKCTFCTIPSFRGAHVSKPIERVLSEANHLAKTGCKEIILIAQEVTQYGYDLYREFTLPRLLRELNQIDGIEWIRILYFYPNRLTDEVIETMASCDKVAKYIDIPLQHTHPDTLRRMKRPWDGERYLKLVEKVRAAMPSVAIRTTFIVGFPGETDLEFEHMIDFIKEARLDRVGAFVFSREPGTPSYNMPDQVPFRVKRQRYDRLMRTQQEISQAVNQSYVGRELKVLIEDKRDGWLVGRSERDAPDIDGLVFVVGNAAPGSFVKAEVTAAEPYDLYARLTSAGPMPRRLLKLRQAAPLQPR